MGFGLLECTKLEKEERAIGRRAEQIISYFPPFPDLPSTDICDNNNFLPS